VHGEDGTARELIRWGQRDPNVRALVLTSTRAVPGGHVDAYSDWDVIAVVRDVRSLVENTAWQNHFGDVLISYWDPVQVDPSTGADWVGNITNYVDGLKIDFNLWSTRRWTEITGGPCAHPELDAGHRVLLDKDGLTAGLPPATFAAYIPPRPDVATFHRLITDFLVGVPYVAKGLLRGQLLPTKWVLDFDMRFNYLVPMLEWRVECDHDWSLRTGNLGKGLEVHLPAETLAWLDRTFTGAETEANWTALFEMIGLFDHVGREVSERLGYDYPEALVKGVTEHARRMRNGVFANGPLRGSSDP
jgi:aminoglycoside 6-adenylyltransferase